MAAIVCVQELCNMGSTLPSAFDLLEPALFLALAPFPALPCCVLPCPALKEASQIHSSIADSLQHSSYKL